MKDGYPFRSINDLRGEDQEIIGNMIIKARDIAQSQGIAESGYKIHINAERGGDRLFSTFICTSSVAGTINHTTYK